MSLVLAPGAWRILPALALMFLAALAVLTHGGTGPTARAATDGAAMSMHIGGATGKVNVDKNSQFTLTVTMDSRPSQSYTGVQAWVDFGGTGLTPIFNPPPPSENDGAGFPGTHSPSVLWADCEPATSVSGTLGNSLNAGCLSWQGPASFLKGDIYTFEATCDEDNSHTITLLALGDKVASTSGSGWDTPTGQVAADNTDAGNGNLVADTIDVNCIPVTDTPTPLPTATPPPVPRMSKSPALQNVWLTRQGSKMPPSDCLSGTDIGGLAEGLGQEIDTFSPKGEPQTLAAFEFEVHYDNQKVCIMLSPGVEFERVDAICVTSNTEPRLEGVARMGCVTMGKGHAIDELVALAQIDVYPQPELYSQMKPNQENGVVVQINNVNCDLGDEQGHAIAIFSCDDADITFRYLEGDVEPDCVVDAADAQAIAFRWGVSKGSSIYRDFMNLEPSGAQADDDIDINDLQFVFGRFGSTCGDPHPPQAPVNPKG